MSIFINIRRDILSTTGVNYTVTTPVANLPPVSTTPAVNFPFGTAGVVDTVGKLPQESTTPVANLPPVSFFNNGNNIRLLVRLKVKLKEKSLC
jgi:hypothetical protein